MTDQTVNLYFRFCYGAAHFVKLHSLHFSVCAEIVYDFYSTVMTLSFRTDRSGQTVQTQIRLLLEEQSD